MSRFQVNRDAILKKRDKFKNPEKYKTDSQNDSPFWKIPDGNSSVLITICLSEEVAALNNLVSILKSYPLLWGFVTVAVVGTLGISSDMLFD